MNKKPDFYAIKTLALIFFGMIGVFALIYLIALAFTQKTLLNGILFGMLAILFAPLVNTVTGFFDDSVEATPRSTWKNYWEVLVSLVLSLLFIPLIMPFIALSIAAVIGGMLILVILVGYIIYLFQQVLQIDLGASNDFGLWELTKYLLVILAYEATFFTGYFIYNKNEEKIWDWIRKVFNR